MSRVVRTDGRPYVSPPRAAAVRPGPTSSFQQLRELTERHARGDDIRWASSPRRVAQRRPPAVRHACLASSRRRLSTRRARPMSSPLPAPAPDVAAGSRDGGSSERGPPSSDGDGDGGGPDLDPDPLLRRLATPRVLEQRGRS
jgi:hypothetical protein